MRPDLPRALAAIVLANDADLTTGAGYPLEASNFTVTANMTFDIVSDDGRRRIVPYLAAGGGYLRQEDPCWQRTGSHGARAIHVE